MVAVSLQAVCEWHKAVRVSRCLRIVIYLVVLPQISALPAHFTGKEAQITVLTMYKSRGRTSQTLQPHR